uniref:3-deoxy-8-phosphooctulonate synthase n=1 Tax=Quercus lobata TaxID=97700 RepID=A0A7N2LLT0_QUELO
MESSALLFNQLKAADPFFLLAGPSVIESKEHIFRMAKHIKTVASKMHGRGSQAGAPASDAAGRGNAGGTPQTARPSRVVPRRATWRIPTRADAAKIGADAAKIGADVAEIGPTRVGLLLVFKLSFDKANRTSSKSFRGPGMVEGLKILERVKLAYDIPIVTAVHETIQCEAVGRVADIIQIPAFLCRQTNLLVAQPRQGKLSILRKASSVLLLEFCLSDKCSYLQVMVNSAEKIRLAGNPNVMVCERGTMFGYNHLIVDLHNFEWMRGANSPVVADVSHMHNNSLLGESWRKTNYGYYGGLLFVAGFTDNGAFLCQTLSSSYNPAFEMKTIIFGWWSVASGGLCELIPCIARTAVVVGVDGIFMEVHDDPLNAPVDGPTQWPLRHLEELLEELVVIAKMSTAFHCIEPRKCTSANVEKDQSDVSFNIDGLYNLTDSSHPK